MGTTMLVRTIVVSDMVESVLVMASVVVWPLAAAAASARMTPIEVPIGVSVVSRADLWLVWKMLAADLRGVVVE